MTDKLLLKYILHDIVTLFLFIFIFFKCGNFSFILEVV